MTGDPNFADYDEGLEVPMPGWFDADFVEAVVSVGASLPDPRRGYGARPESPAKILAQRLKKLRPAVEK